MNDVEPFARRRKEEPEPSLILGIVCWVLYLVYCMLVLLFLVCVMLATVLWPIIVVLGFLKLIGVI